MPDAGTEPDLHAGGDDEAKSKALSNVNSIPQIEKYRKDIISTGDAAIKEKEQTQTTLFQAKDRSQYTSATAMSVLNIGLLKQVLDQGPKDNKYYEVSLALLGASLILQVLVGIIALGVSNTRNYLEKHNEDGRQMICENICHCKLVRRSKKRSKARNHTRSHSNMSGRLSKIEGVVVFVDDEVGDDDNEACCPWKCTTQIYDKYENEILTRYDDLMPSLVQTQLKMVRANEMISELSKRIAEIQKAKNRLEALIGEGDDEAEEVKVHKSSLETLNTEWVELTKKKRGFEEDFMECSIGHKQNKLLYKYVDAITKNRVLKRASFWQGTINYMLYLIFVLNAFITGFGIASSQSSPNGTEIFTLANSTTL